MFCEKLLGYFCDKALHKFCWWFCLGWWKSGSAVSNLCKLILHMAQVQEEDEIWRRFGGGSDRNRALSGNPVQPVHDMQIVQGRINTGDFASC